jgi:hypothetical protein
MAHVLGLILLWLPFDALYFLLSQMPLASLGMLML